MKFGKVEHPEHIDFTMPNDDLQTERILLKYKDDSATNVFVGCAKWNKQDLKNFYPKGTSDELAYYASQFNCIELNATFYRIFSIEQHQKWYNKTPENFKFFPKLVQNISHLQRLNDKAYVYVDEFLNSSVHLQEKLGTIFLQLHDNFGPKNWDRVVKFVDYWPKEFPLAIEFRHTDWFNDVSVATEMYQLLEENNISNILVDTAGRRDIMHMRLTNNEAFIRYVGANHKTDKSRLDDWVMKLLDWKEKGLKNIYFFVHQNMEIESPLLSAYFIAELNKKLGCNLHIPKTMNDSDSTLF